MAESHESEPVSQTSPWGKHVLVDFEDGIAWVTLNRPEKRNAMNPPMHDEMLATLDALEIDDRCKVLVLTGAGESFSSGMDLKEFFRAFEKAPHVMRMRNSRTSALWQWGRLRHYYKPTIAMVNGWCVGGGLTPMIACDIAIASETAKFGVSEINWGIIPAGNVAKVLAEVMNNRQALYYVMTGELFDGAKAAALGLVTETVPHDRLRARTKEVAAVLMSKSVTALRQSKIAFKYASEMTWDEANEYLLAKNDQSTFIDPERSREKGMSQFLDDKSYRPGLQGFRREE